MNAFTVNVPATSANLGPGFDVIGVALQLYNQFTFQKAQTTHLTFAGPYVPSQSLATDEQNLIYQAYRLACQRLQVEPYSLAIAVTMNIPPGRGLGSSATAIVAGLLAASALHPNDWNTQHWLELATEMEGHPDNVAPALMGGCRISMNTPAGLKTWTVPIPPQLYWVVLIPDFELSTAKARQVVPQQVSRADCLFNIAAMSALLTGFYQNDCAAIQAGLQDRIHQPYREPLVPGMSAVIAAAQEAGALGCVLSGAGPTLLALTLEQPEHLGRHMKAAWAQHGIQAENVTVAIDDAGANILKSNKGETLSHQV